MPIVIQELLASDTLSQAVDKINFNFDQLLLNGGGPVGPIGSQGPTGPIGGRGIRGATWYDGSADPNTLIIPGIDEDDYFLQSDGEVWQYNGTVWVQTSINLTGPTGSTGSSVGFDYIGGYNGINPPTSINNENVAFVVPMPAGISGGANQLTNQGVSTIMLGAVGSTVTPPAGITYTSAFQIPDKIARQLDSSLVSVLIHQKDSSSSAIRFMGGGDITSDKYEQISIGNLSNISLGIDDAFNINVPKPATSPTSLADLIGFNLNTIRRGQQFFAGKQINFTTGNDISPSGFANEISDATFTINTSNASRPAKFSVSTTLKTASALFEVGGNISIIDLTTKTGSAQLEANYINMVGGRIRLINSASHGIDIRPSGITISGSTSPITISTINSQNINLNSNGEIEIDANDLITITSSDLLQIQAITSITNASPIIDLYGGASTHQIRIDNSSVVSGGVKLRGNLTWTENSLSSPLATTHRNISITKSVGSIGNASIYVGHTSVISGKDLMIEVFKGTTQASAIERARINTASFEVINTDDKAGFVGYAIENSSTAMSQNDIGFKLSGKDRASSSSTVETRFHASEDTTSVYNRMQYVRKVYNINPLTAGTPESASTFVIPASYMDTTFLDVYIGYSGGGAVGINLSPNDFNIGIPDGVYPGQKLALHVAVLPTGTFGFSGAINWPAGLSSATANIGIVINNFTGGTSKQIGTIIATSPLATPRKAGEFFAELMWIGATYTSVYETPSSSNTLTGSRGWVITNLLSPTTGGEGATNTEAQMETQFDLTLT